MAVGASFKPVTLYTFRCHDLSSLEAATMLNQPSGPRLSASEAAAKIKEQDMPIDKPGQGCPKATQGPVRSGGI